LSIGLAPVTDWLQNMVYNQRSGDISETWFLVCYLLRVTSVLECPENSKSEADFQSSDFSPWKQYRCFGPKLFKLYDKNSHFYQSTRAHGIKSPKITCPSSRGNVRTTSTSKFYCVALFETLPISNFTRRFLHFKYFLPSLANFSLIIWQILKIRDFRAKNTTSLEKNLSSTWTTYRTAPVILIVEHVCDNGTDFLLLFGFPVKNVWIELKVT